MDNIKQNAYDATELLAKVDTCSGLSPEEAVWLFNADINSEQLCEKAADIKRDIFSESVTVAAEVKVEPEKSIETEIKRAAGAGHKRLHIKLSGNLQTDRDAVKIAAGLFDSDHCGCIEISARKFGDEFTGLTDSGAELGFIEVDDKTEQKEVIDSIAAIKSSGHKLVGIDLNLSSEPTVSLRQVIELCSELDGQDDKLFAAVVRVCSVDNADKAALIRFCALLSMSLPFVKIGVQLDRIDEAVDYVKAGASILYLTGETVGKTDEVVRLLTQAKILTGFCAACVSCDRYSGEYLTLCADKQLYNYCYLNSLLSLREYVADHATRDTRIAATDLILNRLYGIGNKQVRDQMALAMKQIRGGERGFRY